MNYVKRIICLANSRKMSGPCIAGLETEGSQIGSWIRPGSGRPTQEISPSEQGREESQSNQDSLTLNL